MTLLVFAGSSQLAAMPLIVAGAPAWVILATGFCVNLRFVVFSLHLRPYLMHLPRWRRLTHGYLTADLSYVLFTRRFPQPAGRRRRTARAGGLPGRQLLPQLGQLGRLPACWASRWRNFIPTHWGLGFAGILCLVGILCSLATTRLRIAGGGGRRRGGGGRLRAAAQAQHRGWPSASPCCLCLAAESRARRRPGARA